MTLHPDAAHHLAPPAEGYILKRWGRRVELLDPSGAVERREEFPTAGDACFNMWQWRKEVYARWSE